MGCGTYVDECNRTHDEHFPHDRSDTRVRVLLYRSKSQSKRLVEGDEGGTHLGASKLK